MPAIEVVNLQKHYRSGWFSRRNVSALQGVSLQVQPGEIFGLLGPNGAGKTTLIKILLGVVRKSGGTAQVLGLPAGSRAARQRIGYLPENHRIPRHLTGATALEYYGALNGLSLADVRARRPRMLELVGLAGRERDSVATYSKGMLQRLGLAQAMLHEPDLIILDEPTDGVDPVGRADIRRVLRQLKAEGRTIFLNSHLLQEVETLSDRVAIMDRGKVKTAGRVADLTVSRVRFELEVEGTRSRLLGALDGLVLEDVVEQSSGRISFRLAVPDPQELDQVVDRLRGAELGLRRLTPQRSSLEEAFIQIMQQAPATAEQHGRAN
jgi:ABC-2 type transport system ATP-binding protein